MILKVPEIWDHAKYGPGTVVEWFKNQGEEIAENDLLCQIMVVKATHNIFSTEAGALGRIIADTGDEVMPGDDLAEITTASAVVKEAPEPPPEGKREQGQVRATPSARRLARQKGIDISMVKGTGKGGSVTGEDVLSFTGKGEKVEVSVSAVIHMKGIRKATADAMMRSMQNSAQLTLHSYADVTWLAEIRSGMERRLSFNDLICFFAARALLEHQELNAHVVEGNGIRRFRNVNLGVSVQGDDGLYSVVVENAGSMDEYALAERIAALVGKVKDHTVSNDDLSGSTFTVSNLGMAGITQFTPILNPPEVAILGVGSIEEFPVLTESGISFRKRMGLSLTIDHRAVDGYDGALYLGTLREMLENPGSVLGKK